jgi:hypothetical protein
MYVSCFGLFELLSMVVSNLCLFICMVQTPGVAHQLLNLVFSDLCLSACLHCTPVHVYNVLLLIMWSYLCSLVQMLIVL